jgi:hypothetical protein
VPTPSAPKDEPGRPAAISSSVSFDESHVANGLEQAAVIVAIEMTAQDAGLTPLVDGRRANTELLGELASEEHAPVTQALIPAL